MSCLFVVFIFLLPISLAYSQSKETGAIVGTVKDDELKPLPGVSVILSSPNLIGGPKTATTNEYGKYRFVALPPGTYSVDVKLEGFVPAKSERIELSVGVTLTADFVLKVGGIEKTIEVIGKPPLIDVRGSSTAEIALDRSYLENIPNRNVTLGIVNLAPGVTNTGSAFGGEENSGILAESDSVNNTESLYGSGMAVRLDYNAVQEAKIMGVGAPAEYDGIEGIMANMITKSGGNNLQAHGEFIYEGKSWNSSNTSIEALKPPVESYYDANAYLGGPLIKDKLWFFTSFRHERTKQDVTGFSSPIDDKKYNGLFKVTAQATKSTRIQGFFDLERWKIDNWNATSLTSPEAAYAFDLHNNVWNASLLHTFSNSTFLEAKIAGYSGAQVFQGNEGKDTPSHYDLVTGRATGNSGYYGNMPIQRLQLNASLSHHAEDFIIGTHDFKFGVQYENGNSQLQQGYSGGKEYIDVLGSPYLLIKWAGFESHTDCRTLSFFAQDSWNVTSRLTINPGLRYNLFRGIGKITDQTIYKNSGVAPRIGFSYNLFGDNSTVLKAHYGWYYSSLKGNYFKAIDDKYQPLTYSIWLGPGVGYFDFLTLNLGGTYKMDPNIKHPRQEEFTVALERELIKDFSLSVTYILRNGENFIQDVNYTGTYVPQQIVDPGTGKTITVWLQTNPGNNKYILTNPGVGGPYDAVKVDPKKRYQALEFVLNKRFSNKWMMIASYIFSKTRGTFSNEFGGSQPGLYGLYNDPNNQTNAYGSPNDDPTHMFKLQATTILPFGISCGINFTYESGTTYTRTLPVLLPQGLVYINAEERGARRLKPYESLDFRIEKQFYLGDRYKLGVFADAFNLFNRSVATAVLNTSGPNFENPISLTSPRAIRAGVRFFFN